MMIRRLALGGVAAATLLVLAGCNDRNALFVLERAPVFYSRVDAQAATGFPRGELRIDNFRVVQIDFDHPDAFGRATGTSFGRDATPRLAVATHGSTADPRSPAPIRATGIANFFIYGPDFWGAPFYNFWMPGLSVEDPTKRYALALARYAVTPVGQLDHAERLLTGTISQPDQLTLVNANPGGHFLGGNNFGSGCREPVTTANPFVVGTVTAAEAVAWEGIDMVLCPGPWYSSAHDPATFPFMANAQTGFTTHQYNYIVVYEADLATGAPMLDRIVSRRQIGPDLNPNDPTRAFNNAYAPLPTAAASQADLLAGPGVAGAPDEITIEVYHLDALSGGRNYQVWLFNVETGQVASATADVLVEEEIRVVSDAGDVSIEYETVAEESGVSTFQGVGGDGVFRHTITITDDLLGSENLSSFTHAFISEETGTASTPSNIRPVWRQFVNQGGTPDNFFDDSYLPGLLRFGQFRMEQDPYLFSARGTGQAEFFGDELRVTLNGLARPPAGFYYVAWLVNTNTGARTRIGPIESLPPARVSLRDADVDGTLPGVTIDAIVEASVTASESALGIRFYDFNAIQVTLEPKSSPEAVMAPAMVLQAPVPDPLIAQRPRD